MRWMGGEVGGEQLEKKDEFKICIRTTYEYVYIATRSLARFPRMQCTAPLATLCMYM